MNPEIRAAGNDEEDIETEDHKNNPIWPHTEPKVEIDNGGDMDR